VARQIVVAPVTDRVLTVPNALSAARLVAVPAFGWAVLTGHDGWALGLLIGSGVSDYLDGKIARRWGQTSRLGQILDPAADRLYILATLLGLAYRAVIPWWLVGVLVAREVVLGLALLVVRRYGYRALSVHLAGKAATFALLYAFPLLLLAQMLDAGGVTWVGELARVLGWATAIWGTGLYWWSALLYLGQVRDVVTGKLPPAAPPSSDGATGRAGGADATGAAQPGTPSPTGGAR
jgi:cardiolipin synthase